jgi:hypothetical protein
MAITLSAWSAWSQNSITQIASKDYTVTLNVGEATGATYSWVVTPANGTSTDLGAITGNTATIVWDGSVGDYTVTVQVTDGNGCLSENITQDMEILAPGDLIFAAALPSTQTCSDLAGGIEGSVPGQSESFFQISYDGDANLTSANVTIKNPDGVYTDLLGTVLLDQSTPEITITNAETDKEIDFSVTDSWENASSGNVIFEIALLSALTSDNADITADTSADIERTVTVLPKPVIDFQ